MQFGSFVASRRVAIIKVGTGSDPSFLKGIRRYFAAEHRFAVAFGYIDRWSTIAFSAWSTKVFGGPFATRRGASTDASGYYLFVDGQAIAFDQGVAIDANFDLKFALGAAAVSLIARSPAIADGSLEMLDRQASERVIDQFEKMIIGRLLAGDRGESGAAPKAEVQPVDPFAVLKIRSDARDEEVESAYREQIRLNHPDVVARAGPEIQRIANERTTKIIEAHQMILKLRRGK